MLNTWMFSSHVIMPLYMKSQAGKKSQSQQSQEFFTTVTLFQQYYTCSHVHSQVFLPMFKEIFAVPVVCECLKWCSHMIKLCNLLL